MYLFLNYFCYIFAFYSFPVSYLYTFTYWLRVWFMSDVANSYRQSTSLCWAMTASLKWNRGVEHSCDSLISLVLTLKSQVSKLITFERALAHHATAYRLVVRRIFIFIIMCVLYVVYHYVYPHYVYCYCIKYMYNCK